MRFPAYSVTIVAATVALAAIAATPAVAYVGPGTGVGTVGGVLSVLGGIVVAVLGVLLFPLHMFIKFCRRRSRLKAPAATHAADNAS